MQNSKSTKKIRVNKHIIKGSVTGIIVLATSIIISASIILKTTPDNKYYLPVFIACLIISGLLSGLAGSFNQQNKGIVNGIASSVLPAVIAFAAVSFTAKTISLTYFIVPLIIIISGAIGGITAKNIKTKRKRR